VGAAEEQILMRTA